MAYDKKNRDGKIQFVLIKNFGEILVDVSVDKKSVIRCTGKNRKDLV